MPEFLKNFPLLLLAISLLLGAASVHASEHPLFVVQDREPGYEDAQVSLITDTNDNSITHFRITTGGRDFMKESLLVHFKQGQSITHFFVSLKNIDFDRTKGGKLQIQLGKQKLDLDIVRKGSTWTARTHGKRLRRVTVSVHRVFGVPIGVRGEVPLDVARLDFSKTLAALSPELPTDPRVSEIVLAKADTTDGGTAFVYPSTFATLAQ